MLMLTVALVTSASDTLEVNTSGKELTDVRQNNDLRWLRPDGETKS